MISCYAVIPARYASSRFPGKPLALLNGKPILCHVYERVLSSELFDEVIIATDDLRISAVAQDFGATVVLTPDDLPSGTDRTAAVAEVLEPDSLILNVQGDEPMIDKAALQTVISAFDDMDVKMASLMTPITDIEELNSPNVVKVVTDVNGDAMYFSRSHIPFDRDQDFPREYYRHIGVYGFKHSALMQFVRFPAGKYEQIEKLEQLRALENGLKIRMCKTDYQGFGIDTPQDLEKLSQLIF
ncbi:MAG: 3-deoxy-manno-octulosonate cytidylyltransferase [Candidatus Cloacimonetes bacterium]|nr:3-deoxy-manno-octulosonate cytidylyltransferase [Candidatus Cloacimonadota bacterium]MDD3533775.1 3-deoxy-manno-octulosonate cytidylyltransferase [Candidatus Cloacimonadota bacterium]